MGVQSCMKHAVYSIFSVNRVPRHQPSPRPQITPPMLPYLRQLDNRRKCPPCGHCLTSQPPDPSSPQWSPELGMLSERESAGDSILLGVVWGLEAEHLGLGAGDKETNPQDVLPPEFPARAGREEFSSPFRLWQTQRPPETSEFSLNPVVSVSITFLLLTWDKILEYGKVALESERPVLTTGSAP